MTQVESASARDRSRRPAPGARYTETALDESVTERAAAARPPVRSQAAQYSTAGSQDVLRPAESGQREGGFLHDDAARPARSDSPYAAAGLLLSPPRHVGQDPVLDETGHGQDLFGRGISDDDVPLRARSAAAFRLRHSTRAGTGTPASFPPWTAPEIRDQHPLSLCGSQLLPRRAHPLLLGSSRSQEADDPNRQVLRACSGVVARPGSQVPSASHDVGAGRGGQAAFPSRGVADGPGSQVPPESRGVADGPGSQVPPPAASKKGKRPKKLKTTEEKLDTLSADFKALTKEWMACKGELVTVRSMLTTLTGQVNVGVETGGHVLNVVKHFADKPSVATILEDAAPAAPPRPVACPLRLRAQAHATMRWFKPLKVRFMPARDLLCLPCLLADTVVAGSMGYQSVHLREHE